MQATSLIASRGFHVSGTCKVFSLGQRAAVKPVCGSTLRISESGLVATVKSLVCSKKVQVETIDLQCQERWQSAGCVSQLRMQS